MADMRAVLGQFIGGALGDLDRVGIEDLIHALAQVIGALKVKEYAAGVTLCHEGVQEDVLYVIAKGRVAVYKQITPEAEKDLLATKGPGEFFGEMALVLDAPRSADVITTEPAIMLELDRGAFQRATRYSPHLAALMSQTTIATLDTNWHKAMEKSGRREEPFQIFTSYSSIDRDFVLPLVNRLQESLHDNNITLWLDQAHIKPGDRWDVAIEAALARSHAMLLVLSANAIASDNVRDEWSYYREEGKQIIPILKEKCDRPARLRRFQYVDFSEIEYELGLARTHAAILELATNRDQPATVD